MQIKSEFTAYIFIDSYGEEYLRLSKNMWLDRYRNSYVLNLLQNARLEKEFQEQLKLDYHADKYA
jgi:hypothetical protein